MNIDYHFAGPNSLDVYRSSVPILTVTFKEAVRVGFQHGWDPKTNTLKVLIVTPKDIDPTGRYKSIKWDSIIGCNYPTTKESIDASFYLSEQSKKLYRIISNTVENGLMKPSDFSAAVIQNPDKIVEAVGGVTYAAMQNLETAKSFSKIFLHNGDPIIVVTLKDNPYDTIDDTIRSVSGIDREYFSKIKGSARAYKINGMAHEFGHGMLAHYTPNNHPSEYDCVKLNFEIKDKRVVEEGEADIIGGIGLRVAAERGLITHEDAQETAREIEALRAIGNFYQSADSFLLFNNDGVNIHLTTLLYDPTKLDFRSDFMKSIFPTNVSAIPALVNSLANTLIGFVYAHKLSVETKVKPRLFKNETRELFETVAGTPFDAMLNFADLGSRVKFGSEAENGIPEVKKQPEYFVAAMMYLRDSGGLNALRSKLKPELYPAYDDLMKDFFNAVENYGSPKLLDKEIYDLFEEKIPKDINYSELIKEIITISNDMDRLQHHGDTPVPETILVPRIR